MVECCRQPFTAIEITQDGEVYTCCPSFVSYKSIGNIWKHTIEEIWYGTKANELRKKIYNNDFSLCNIGLCRQKQIRTFDDNILDNIPLPKYVTLSYDRECNLQCITCRDKKIKNSQQEIELYNEKIDSVLVPLLKEAEIIALSGGGEAFYSSHSRLLIKKITASNPKIEFNINTNGILFNEANCRTLGVYGKINEVFVSLPSLNPDVYSKIMLGSDLETVKQNIKWMSLQQNQTKSIKRVMINMVISVLNYKEIINLVKYAQDLDIWITLAPYWHWGTKFGSDYNQVAVWQKTHPEYSEFIEILHDDSLNYCRCWLNSLFKDLI